MCRRGRHKKKGKNKEAEEKTEAEEELRRKRVAVTRWIRESNEFEGVLVCENLTHFL